MTDGIAVCQWVIVEITRFHVAQRLLRSNQPQRISIFEIRIGTEALFVMEKCPNNYTDVGFDGFEFIVQKEYSMSRKWYLASALMWSARLGTTERRRQ